MSSGGGFLEAQLVAARNKTNFVRTIIGTIFVDCCRSPESFFVLFVDISPSGDLRASKQKSNFP
jgi:hypothetical protein